MKTLINDWRKRWNQISTIPFFYFNKNEYPANFNNQMKILKNTIMIDNKGLGQTLHPKDKLQYAKRLFKKIMTTTYQNYK